MLLNFFEWWQKHPLLAAKPWLVLGKGPSYDLLPTLEKSEFHWLSLNHAARDVAVDIAHFIDLDALDGMEESLKRNAGVLVMPWHPHRQNKATKETLEQLAKTHPLLGWFADQGKLLWYNLRTTKWHNAADPRVVQVQYFSAEAVVNLLAEAGVRTIRTLGVDGGNRYSSEFADLNQVTLLANGRSSFDRQFSEIGKSVKKYGLDLLPVGVQTPVKVFVGTTEQQEIPTRVLEWSIKEHSSLPVEVQRLHLSTIQIPQPRDSKNQPRTPFSFQRFLIPELCGFKGRAIYVDSDMQVFTDIREMWTLDLAEQDILTVANRDKSNRLPQFSVMLMNCETLRWKISEIVDKLDRGELTYEQLVHQMVLAPRISAAIHPRWNSLEHYDQDETALTHYTDMNTQPWVSRRNRHGKIWCEALLKCVDAGMVPLSLLAEHSRQQWIRPSLVYQMEHRITDPAKLPKVARALDRAFEAPFEAILAREKSLGLRARRLAGRLTRWTRSFVGLGSPIK
jgi:hypothetical protein